MLQLDIHKVGMVVFSKMDRTVEFAKRIYWTRPSPTLRVSSHFPGDYCGSSYLICKFALSVSETMTSANAPHLKLLECCGATTVRRIHLTTSTLPPSLRQIHSYTTWASLKSRILPSKFVPLVAQTSDWAQQEEEEGEEESVESDGGGLEEDSYSEPSEEAKLFVGNLPYDVDSEKLAQMFDRAGVVEISEVIYNRQTDQSRGFGFVTMSTVEEAEKAVEMFNGYDINGRVLTVNKAAPRGSQPERSPRLVERASFRMYVGNLPWQVDNAKLEEVFSEHGKVVDARVVYDRETGRSRGFGFVTMSTETELNDAIAALDGQSLGGRAIRVNIAEERPRRSF